MRTTNLPLLKVTEAGLFCPPGDFHIDPWRPVDRAVVTHAHADHACFGCRSYLTTPEGLSVLRVRQGPDAEIQTLDHGVDLNQNGVRLSLHPAGHILGSAQVRLEYHGEVWVVSGDYKTEADPTCAPFEPVRCHTFISESTFGLPIYRWSDQETVFRDMLDWWRVNQASGKTSLIFAYALGKSQRILAGLASLGELPGPILTHGAVETMTEAYRAAAIPMPATVHVSAAAIKGDGPRPLVVAPPSAQGTPWLRRFGNLSTGFASGWMRIRGTRRRRSVDRGFVLSDHADWPGLLAAIDDTGAERVLLTHGYSAVVARWLRSRGKEADVISTQYSGERDDAPAPETAEADVDPL